MYPPLLRIPRSYEPIGELQYQFIDRMKLAIMQPYLFPYIGYFQLMHAVDRFVVYDDVTYIKQGWINRNRIMVNGQPHMFTLPLRNAGSNVAIRDIEIGGNEYVKWRNKFLRTLEQAYKKAPFRSEVIALMEDVLKEDRIMLADLLRRSLQAVIDRLSINVVLVPTSSIYGNSDLSGAERVLDICERERADAYVNAIGGKDLYDRETFASRGVELAFLRSRLPEYDQEKIPFVSGLSILDTMMFVPAEELQKMMAAYDLD